MVKDAIEERDKAVEEMIDGLKEAKDLLGEECGDMMDRQQ